MNTLTTNTSRDITGKTQNREKLGAGKTGLVLGLVLAGWHAGWAALVAMGVAQPIINFVMKVHFIDANFAIQPFELSTAALLVGLNAITGFGIGALFAIVWNALRK